VEGPAFEDEADQALVADERDARDPEARELGHRSRLQRRLCFRRREDNDHHCHLRSFLGTEPTLVRELPSDHPALPAIWPLRPRNRSASSVRLRAPSFFSAFDTWRSTVFGDRNSACAISRLVAPEDTSSATSRSRFVR